MSPKKPVEKKPVETPAKEEVESKVAEDANALVDSQAEVKALQEKLAKAEADAAAAVKKAADKKADPLHYPEGQESKKVKSKPAPKGKTLVRTVGADGNYRFDYV